MYRQQASNGNSVALCGTVWNGVERLCYDTWALQGGVPPRITQLPIGILACKKQSLNKLVTVVRRENWAQNLILFTHLRTCV